MAGVLVTGMSFVAILVVRRETELIVAILGVVAFGFSAYALVAIARLYERLDAVIYAFAFMVAGAGGGWALASALLERLATEPHAPELPTRPSVERTGAAVILFACIESMEYDPVAVARTLQRLSDEELIETSIGTLPFFFFAQKARYRAIGGRSPAYSELRTIAEHLESELKGTGCLFDHATCSGERTLASRVGAAAQEGYATIVVVELAVGDSLSLSEAKRQADALHLETLGVRVIYTSALGQSERITSMLSDRVLHVTDDPATTGVILLGHGQPDVRARKNPGFDEQENALLNRVRMRLTEAGLNENSVRIAWAEWRTPDITSSVRHLAALGCQRIIVVPGTFPLDTIVTRLDLELAVRQARVDDAISVVTLPAWSDDPGLIEELAERVRAEL